MTTTASRARRIPARAIHLLLTGLLGLLLSYEAAGSITAGDGLC